MADQTTARGLAGLKLSAEERENVAGVAGDMIAIQVYRELQKANDRISASDSGCQIVGNCSCSSKSALLAGELSR